MQGAKKEALDDFAAQAKTAGNFIVGRKTFEAFAASGGGGAFADLDIVVLSSSIKALPGIKLVGSPQEALTYLQEKGHTTALLAGGAALAQCLFRAWAGFRGDLRRCPCIGGERAQPFARPGPLPIQGCAVVGFQVPWRWRRSVALRARS